MSHDTCLNYVAHAQADQAWHTKNTPIFAPTAGALSSISPKLCMLMENVVTILKGVNHFSVQRSFSFTGENADFWSLTHWVLFFLNTGRLPWQPAGNNTEKIATQLLKQFVNYNYN